MKVLIWFLCILVNAIITAVIKENGIILGGIPTAFLTFATLSLAFFLCRKWDEYNQVKNPQNDKSPTDNQNVKKDKIKFCRKCGFELVNDSEFCSQCGTKVYEEN